MYNSRVILFCAFVLLFAFKYPLDGFFGTGIRIEDFLIFFTFLFYLHCKKYKIDNEIFLPSVLLFFVWTMFTTTFNYLNSNVSFFLSAMFNFRHVEYFLLFFIGLQIKKESWFSLLKLFVVYEFIIVIVQKFGLLGFATRYNVIERQVGSTSGPWELAVMIAFPLFLFLYKKNYKYFLISIFVLMSTESRITIASVLLVLIIIYLRKFLQTKAVNSKIVVFLSCLVAIILSQSLNLSNYTSRITSVFEIKTESTYYVENAITSSRFAQIDDIYIKSNVSNTQGDASAYSRFSRWLLALNTVNSNGAGYFITGLGSSFFGDALDGAYLRILVTNGVIGLVLFILIYYKVYRRLKEYRYFVAFFLVYIFSGLFIDVFYSLKINIVFWLSVGVLCRYEKGINSN